MDYDIISSDTDLLVKARDLAVRYANSLKDDGTIGIVFLGAVARGYFDGDADIDISIFGQDFDKRIGPIFKHIDNLEVHVFLLDYNAERQAVWNTGKRWAYSQHLIHYDPNGLIKNSSKIRFHCRTRSGIG